MHIMLLRIPVVNSVIRFLVAELVGTCIVHLWGENYPYHSDLFKVCTSYTDEVQCASKVLYALQYYTV